MKYLAKTFNELTTTELHDVLKLRAEIFVVEQKCFYADVDGKDLKAVHVMGFEGSELVSYARCFKPGDYFNECAIGRVAVSEKYRGRKLGEAIMREGMKQCKERFGANEILISAQQHLEKFYNDLDFKTEGDMYLEDDIPHLKMRWRG